MVLGGVLTGTVHYASDCSFFSLAIELHLLPSYQGSSGIQSLLLLLFLEVWVFL